MGTADGDTVNDINHIELTGVVISTPELKITPNGTRIATWDVKFPVQKKGKATTGKIEVNAFGKLCEALEAHTDFRAGVKCCVKGRLSHRSWQTADRFITHKVDIIAEVIEFEGGSSCTF